MARAIDCPTHCRKGIKWVANLCIFNCISLHFSIAKYNRFEIYKNCEGSLVLCSGLRFHREEHNSSDYILRQSLISDFFSLTSFSLQQTCVSSNPHVSFDEYLQKSKYFDYNYYTTSHRFEKRLFFHPSIIFIW